MNTSTKIDSIESKVQFWILLGPFLLVCSYFIMMIRSFSTPLDLPIAALLGMIFCYKWKWKGLLFALTLLTCTLVYKLVASASQDWVWSVILTLTFVCSSIITLLSLDEVASFFFPINQDIAEFKATIHQLDDQLLAFQTQAHEEKQELNSIIEKLKVESAKKEDAANQLISLAKEEVEEQSLINQKLLQDLFLARQQLALEESSTTQNHIVTINGVDESQVHDLNLALQNSKNKEIELQNEIAKYFAELSSLKEEKARADFAMNQAQEEQILQQAIIVELNDHIDMLTREKQLLESTLTRLQAELENSISDKEQAIGKAIQDSEANQARTSELQIEINRHLDEKSALEKRELEYLMLIEEMQIANDELNKNVQEARQAFVELELAQTELQRQLQLSQEKYTLSQTELEKLGDQVEEEKQRNKQMEEEQSKLKEEKYILVQSLSQCEATFNLEKETADRQLRRIQGMYHQLRSQFEEKSATLDSTRKELFSMQEQFYACRKDLEENMNYQWYEKERGLYKLLNDLEQEHDALAKEREDEVSALNSLISSLFSNQLEFHAQNQ